MKIGTEIYYLFDLVVICYLQHCLLTYFRFSYRPAARLHAVILRHMTILHACRIGDV